MQGRRIDVFVVNRLPADDQGWREYLGLDGPLKGEKIDREKS